MICNIIDIIPPDYVTINVVSVAVGVTPTTLTRWYNWYEKHADELPKDAPKLPQYYRTSLRQPRYFKPDTIKQIQDFAEYIPHGRYGIMASENRKYSKK